ncbi:MAG: ATP-binding cassette domain-containing protein [candidate division WOR-3 bacterium]
MIKLVNIEKSFGSNHVLRGVNLEVQDGETVLVVGKSGIGKSVLVKCVVGLLKPDKGEVWIDGIRVDVLNDRELNKLRKRFGYVFQHSALFDWMDVLDNVMLPLKEMGVKPSEARDKALEVLKRVGLEGVENKYPNELSGGMRKRVGIARAIITNPDYLFYDEPTSGLDPLTSRLIYDLMEELNEELSCTTIIITHDIELIRRFGKRVLYLDNGTIEFDGPVENAHLSPSFSKFLGNLPNYTKG